MVKNTKNIIQEAENTVEALIQSQMPQNFAELPHEVLKAGMDAAAQVINHTLTENRAFTPSSLTAKHTSTNKGL